MGGQASQECFRPFLLELSRAGWPGAETLGRETGSLTRGPWGNAQAGGAAQTEAGFTQVPPPLATSGSVGNWAVIFLESPMLGNRTGAVHQDAGGGGCQNFLLSC